MNQENAASPPPQQDARDTETSEPAATMMFHDASAGNTTDPASSKQIRDLTFASFLLRSGSCTERQLIRAIANWTTHGSPTLAEHLVAEGVIAEAQSNDLSGIADARLKELIEATADLAESTDSQRQRDWLAQLDSNGKIAKLLGIADASMLVAGEIQSREVGARYTLLRKLGEGGLGTVWLARDENLHRYVAVKEITRQRGSDERAIEHFRREAEITGKLEHPGIVPVYQFGTDEQSGRAFYAMQFVGKRTLQDAITEYHERRIAGNEDPMLRHRLLTAFVNLCQAVAHAHSRKVIHRDLKPENVAVDSFGQIVLLDWGLAKINDETGMHEVNGRSEPGDLHSVGTTHLGRVLGTPHYMAPEQAAGRLEEADELTDVYGLGGILFAILTGEAPHQRAIENGGRTQQMSQVLSAIVSAKTHEPQELNANVPAELNAISAKALSNKRYLRYTTASELAEDVQRYMAGTPVLAYAAPVRQRVRRWMSRHPALTQAILLCTSLFVLGGAAIGWTARQGRDALQEARYDSLQEFARELDMTLQFETQELIHDVRFVTNFPLMRVVVATQQDQQSDPISLAEGRHPIDPKLYPPEEWIERHGTLLEGVLEANPSYLVATTVRFEQPSMTELSRAERLEAGMNPWRAPKQQLFSGEYPDSDNEIYALHPGQVALTTGDQLSEDVPTKNRSPLVLIAVCPIFDDAGEFFGINVIECDLRKRLKNLFLATATDHVEVYITDTNGGVAMTYRDGKSKQPSTPTNVIAIIPEVESVFANGSTTTEFGDNKTIYAVRVRLGNDDSKAQFGIVARCVDERFEGPNAKSLLP